MKCPECNQELKIPTNTVLNIESYHNSVKTITECCGKLIVAYPIFKIGAKKYYGTHNEDDWGRKASK